MPSPASGRGLGEGTRCDIAPRMKPKIRCINPHAKPLRKEMTDAERAVWNAVRSRRLEGFKFTSQWTLGPLVVDSLPLGTSAGRGNLRWPT
jgi:very-short-patch-repair endonuclease